MSMASTKQEANTEEEEEVEEAQLRTNIAVSILRPMASLRLLKLHAVRSGYLATGLAMSALTSFIPAYKTGMSTSLLSGNLWIQFVLEHDNKRYAMEIFGMDADTFMILCDELELEDGKSVCRELQLAIFLLIAKGGLHLWILGDRVQVAKDTSSKYFRLILDRLVNPKSFYSKYVRMPPADPPVPTFIRQDHRFNDYFDSCIGAVDGTHLPIFRKVTGDDKDDPPDWGSFRDRHGQLSWSTLAVCSFDLRFMYVLPGFEGAAHDSKLWDFAIHKDLVLPEGRWLLGDNGFPLSDEVLTPYIGVRYHLQEWARFVERNSAHRLLVQDYAELFNLRHASARNVVERSFGILKRRFGILSTAPEYSISVQSMILPALCAVHNFLRVNNDPSIEEDLDDISQAQTIDANGPNADGDKDDTERDNPQEPMLESSRRRLARCQEVRDQLAERMWRDYCRDLRLGRRERVG